MQITSLKIFSRATQLLLVSLIPLLHATAFAEPTPSAWEAEAKGWSDIQPTADLKGWTRLAIPATNTLGRAQWHLDTTNQLLVCDGDGGHDMLRYDQPITNGIFHVECRFIPLPGKKNYYNSGIFIRNSADGVIWHQCQVMSDGGYLFGNTPVNGENKRFLAQVDSRCFKKAGEWNTVELTAKGKTLSVWCNGAVVCELPDCEVPAGYVALESEGYAIEFRNLKLKTLP